MEKTWSQMSPDEKREERIKKVLATDGIEFIDQEAELKYKQRAKRIIDAYLLKEPDRVPVRLSGAYFSAYYSGISGRDFIYDYGKMIDSLKKVLTDFDADMINASPTLPGEALQTLDFRLYKWPGFGLADEVLSHQYEEGEYMRADEYDALIDDPTDFWVRRYLPRIFGSLAPLEKLFRFTDIYEIPTSNLMPFGTPDVQNALRSLIKAGDEMMKMREAMGEIRRFSSALGFPSFVGGFAKAPFDTVGDTLRGTRGIVLDIYRQPEKLLQAMERLVPLTIKGAVESVNATGKLGVSMPLHKGADGFMSDEQFREFYWPTLKRVLLGMIDEGIMPMLFAEGTYDSRLDFLKELPKGKTVWLFDRSDMARVKEVIGENICIEGNVPASLLTKGTPEAVKQYCRELIEKCGKGGGYVLAPGASAERAKPENMRAMSEAVKEYGVYGSINKFR